MDCGHVRQRGLPSPDSQAMLLRLQWVQFFAALENDAMKPFALDPSMTTATGTFYPTGHVFALFANEEAARSAGQALQAQGRDDVAHATPPMILEHVVRTLGNADAPLPSVGAEGVIVRRIAQLASDGAHGLLLRATDSDAPETLRDLLQPLGPLAAFYYRRLVIEELVPAPAGPAR